MGTETFIEILKSCFPYLVGAIIAVVPITINKIVDWRCRENEKIIQIKQQQYINLISLLGNLLSNPMSLDDRKKLRNEMNLINITGSLEVVKALNNYLSTWGGNASPDEENRKYTELIKSIRVDLKIDKKISYDFPDTGLIDLKIMK